VTRDPDECSRVARLARPGNEGLQGQAGARRLGVGRPLECANPAGSQVATLFLARCNVVVRRVTDSCPLSRACQGFGIALPSSPGESRNGPGKATIRHASRSLLGGACQHALPDSAAAMHMTPGHAIRREGPCLAAGGTSEVKTMRANCGFPVKQGPGVAHAWPFRAWEDVPPESDAGQPTRPFSSSMHGISLQSCLKPKSWPAKEGPWRIGLPGCGIGAAWRKLQALVFHDWREPLLPWGEAL